MMLRRLSRIVYVLAPLALATELSCVTAGTDGNGNSNGDVPVIEVIDQIPDEQDLPPLQADLGEGVENVAPRGSVIFPAQGSKLGVGEIVFIWEAIDDNGTPVNTRVIVGDQQDVFNDSEASAKRLAKRLAMPLVQTSADSERHALTLQINDPGTYFWGIEITDGNTSVQRPASGDGVQFEVSRDITERLDLTGVILLCPGSGQSARQLTTFEWLLGSVVPTRTQLFVSRAGQANPFDSALRVFDVAPPTATTFAVPAGQELPLGQELSWGLRMETADGVRFTFEGQLGVSFLVDQNVPPSGSLVSPADGAVLADNTTSFVLNWSADPGNCEDALTSTVFFEKLNGNNAPVNLFSSPIQVPVGQDVFELSLTGVAQDVADTGGVWAWGVLADDGTDKVELPDAPGGTKNFRTFVRDTAPEFVTSPLVDGRLCANQTRQTLVFSYDDANGVDTVDVRLFFAETADAVFDAALASMELGTPATSQEVVVSVADAVSDSACRLFANGFGFYGVELDDGVNDPVRAIAEYSGPPTGACCLGDGSCVDDTFDNCQLSEGAYEGDFTACADAMCPQLGACCMPNGACVDVLPSECTTGIFQGEGLTCADVSCPPPAPPPPPPPPTTGACCIGDEVCINVSQNECNQQEGTFQGLGTTCATSPCTPQITDCNNNGVEDAIEIEIGSASDCNGNGVPDECDIITAEPTDVPAEDNCFDAQPVCPGLIYDDTTLVATRDGDGSCGTSFDVGDVWYKYTPVTSGTLEVSLCGSSYDTLLSIHSACPGNLDNQFEGACDNNDCEDPTSSRISSFPVIQGVTYFIRVSGFDDNDVGDFVMELTGPPCNPALNDCNANGVPDDCDIAGSEVDIDINSNGVIDSCEGVTGA